MKYIIILGDGMADEPLKELDNKTLLQVANTPYMDKLARLGVTGRMKTIEDGYHPGSEVANMAVLGYHMDEVYEGRGVLEAASMGIELAPDDMAMRCNLVCVEGEILKNHSAEHITTEESNELIKELNERLGSDRIKFYTGVSYRHLLVIKGGDKRIECVPPHDKPLHPFRPLLVKAQVPEAEPTAQLINDLILRSQTFLADHPVNQRRKQIGKDMATSIWPWSPGYRPAMKTLTELFGLSKTAVISAVDLIRGIGRYAGMDVLTVEGATGLYDTNYEGKAAAAIEALKTNDLVYLHIEASDEAGHEGDVSLKMKTIENLDERAVKPIYEAVKDWDEPVAIAVLPDHPTPCFLRTHTNKPVPFLIYKPNNVADEVVCFDEFSVYKGMYGEKPLEKDEFIKLLIS
ncbi:MAG: cofactor-independent phosphoglycerate mutase [Massilibacteroides sp.]|nr:cofactor-independent phosphoglycerate mutase [Massilibacteroides sp.]